MAFASILIVDPKVQSEAIIKNIKTIISEILKIVDKISQNRSKSVVNVAEEITEEELEDEDKRDEYLDKMFKKVKATSNGEKVDDVNDEEIELEEDEEDEDWDDMVDMCAKTQIDKLDEILYVRDVFNHLVNTNKAYYDELMSLIDVSAKIKLQEEIKLAESRQQEQKI